MRAARSECGAHVARKADASDSGLRHPARYGQNDREIALGKKNHLFAGSDGGAEHWAIFSSLINTAKLHEIDPQTYLTDVLERIVSGRTKITQLHQLLPWVWKAAREAEHQNSIAT